MKNLAAEIDSALRNATGAIAPCWPLKDFVAVNPFLGMAHYEFCNAANRLASVAGARLFMPRAFYAEAIATGRIRTEDLEAALVAHPTAGRAVGDLHALRRATLEVESESAPPLFPTVVDVAQAVTGSNWPDFVQERFSKWAAAYFDAGQATWTSPWRHLSPYKAWRAEALIDRTPAVAGLRGFRGAVTSLPESADELISHAVKHLGISAQELEHYFHRLLMAHGGWSAFGRYQDWQLDLNGVKETVLVELLAIRLAWELAFLCCFEGMELTSAWELELERVNAVKRESDPSTQFAVETLLQFAYEQAWQSNLLKSFSPQSANTSATRPSLQAVFCIDVRSEVFRRTLESSGADIETIGFAGFFGIPMAYVPLAHEAMRPQCPALLVPKYVIKEEAENVGGGRDVLARRKAWYGFADVWKSFKLSAVSSFGFVETLGLAFAIKLLSDTLGITRPVPQPADVGLAGMKAHQLKPQLQPSRWNNLETGLTLETRVEIAEGALRTMSLTDTFARVILLTGHGSSSVNNPHAAGLDCGACGGHPGDVNARVMALILNDSEVRACLTPKGILIPGDSLFIAANHDTTTDTITLFDEDKIPVTHLSDIAWAKASLDEASRRARRARAAALNLGGAPSLETALLARSRDWSQVRPEWGLAGCAAFIAAPRHRTRHIDLAGRSFLHNYDWRHDQDFAALELVMTAPLIVASWINLQYYGSTVDNRVFGSGDKTLHNVVGTLGVLEGHGGDLRVGLPWQSLHDGVTLVHEPMRLTALIEAPVQAMNKVIERHENLRALLDNNWLHLYAIDARGAVRNRYTGHGCWSEINVHESPKVVAA